MTRRLLIALTCLCFISACSEAPSATANSRATTAPAEDADEAPPVQTQDKSYDGPFGLEMGLGVEEVQNIIPSLSARESGIYGADSVPTPHKAFESYVLQFSSKSGLCALMAIGKDIESGQTGAQVKSSFNSLADSLTGKYGEGKRYDFATGIMDDPEYWMIALSDKNRTFAQFWDTEVGSTMPEDLSSISLQAHALDMSTGYINLRYEFANMEDCAKEIEAQANQAL